MLIAGNWKMFKGPSEARAFFTGFEPPAGIDVVFCPPFVSLAAAVETGQPIYAQNVHWEPNGPYTGEVSPEMLRELGVQGSLVGHSERRQLFGETDESVARRARAALDAGLGVIACVGETLEQRESGDTELVLKIQVEAIGFATGGHDRLLIAYEPVWAIGTGKTATPEMAEEAHAFIKGLLDRPVLYGGSVKPENAAELMSQPSRRRRPRRRRVARSRLVHSDLPRRVDLVTLVVLDGWGCAPPGPGNAVELAQTPVFDRLWHDYPHTTLKASGEAVGLPEGQMGNSEVGHLTIGSGRILFQDLQRVNVAIRDGSLFENPVLVAAFERARERGGNVHLLGLVSHGGVHSHIDHLQALLELARRLGMEERTWVDAFTDGRDVSPISAASDLAELPAERIATVVGRYYAMDRDKRWERTQKALDAITGGMCTHASPAQLVTEVRRSYDAGVTDEFLEPICVDGAPRLGPDDAAILFNFRPDRGRQLASKLVEAGFDLTTMTRYSSELDVPVVFG